MSFVTVARILLPSFGSGRLGLLPRAACFERGRAAIDHTAADTAQLFEVTAVLVEGSLEVRFTGPSNLVAVVVVFVRMVRRYCPETC